jgi:hypothetical protein
MLRSLPMSDARRDTALLPFAGLAVYMITSVFYVFPSGNPQPADFLLVASIGGTLLLAWNRIPVDPALYLSVGLFIGWIVLVNATWFMIVGDFTFVKKTVFYLYNIGVFLFVVVAGYHDWRRLKKVIWWSCLVALLLQVGFLELLPRSTWRASGSFNNPNQLGYWALLTISCVAVTKEGDRLGPGDLIALAAGFYVVMLSLSKAASIAAMVLLVGVGLTCGTRRVAGFALAAVLLVALSWEIAAGGLLDRFGTLEPVSSLTQRLQSIGGQRDDSLAARGYWRLFEFPQYLAFGAGEGAYDRLTDDLGRAKEFHSSIGNLVMSYGVVGLGVFGVLLAVVFLRAPVRSSLYMLPIMLYGVTHMGLRFSLFWVFLGLVYAEARYGGSRSPTSVVASGRQG